MAETVLAITTEYVKCFLALMGKGFFWPDRVLERLANLQLTVVDVTHVMTHGQVVESEKESADGTAFSMVGETCDDVRILVRFWLDQNQIRVRIVDVDLA